MRIFRLLFSLVLLVFATNNLYITAAWVYHNHAQGWWEAIRMVVLDNLPVVIIAAVIIVGVFSLEAYFLKKENRESDARVKQLNRMESKLNKLDITNAILIAIAKKLGVNTDDVIKDLENDKNGKSKLKPK